MRALSFAHSRAGLSLPEVTIATAISAMMFGALFIGASTVQHSTYAAKGYAEAKAAELRVLDFIALDVRRALKVTRRADGGIDLWIPNYYDTSDPANVKPIEPVLDTKGVLCGTEILPLPVHYGTTAIPVSYFTRDNPARGCKDVIRSYNGVESVLVTDVNNFAFETPAVSLEPITTASVSFVPAFHRGGSDAASKEASKASISILMRNNQRRPLR